MKPAARGSLNTQDAKKSPKIAIWAPSHNFVGSYLLCMKSGTAERIRICAKFTRKTYLVPHSDEFKGQGQRSRSTGTKTTFFALSAACVRFMFGKVSLASSFTITVTV